MSEPHLSLPRGLHLLGWSGTVPFIAALGVGVLEPGLRSNAIAAFVTYGAVILSFLGGTRWGSGLTSGAHPLRFLESVIPSLLALPRCCWRKSWAWDSCYWLPASWHGRSSMCSIRAGPMPTGACAWPSPPSCSRFTPLGWWSEFLTEQRGRQVRTLLLPSRAGSWLSAWRPAARPLSCRQRRPPPRHGGEP